MESERVSAKILTLSELVWVKQGFMRSVNLRRDATSVSVLEGYVLSTHAVNTLGRLLSGLQALQHAWTLTGPYGTGKSLFTLFLSSLLYRKHPAHVQSIAKLRRADPELAAGVESLPEFLPVLAVGRRASPSVCLLEAIADLPYVPDTLQKEIEARLRSSAVEGSNLDDLALTSIEQIAGGGKRPLLIVLDELGKTLEHVALHPETGDLYLLQRIAEMAPRWKVLFIGVLHQAFEAYAQTLDRAIRNEWAKVQGRFEDIPFTESAEQMMRLIAYALEANECAEPVQKGRSHCRQIAEEIAERDLTPPGMRTVEFLRLSEQAYPLHPLTFMLLPYLFRHHAQNERTLFAFLTQHEPFGLQQFLSSHVSCDGQPALLGLPYLYDYVTSNFRRAVYTSIPLRPVAEVEQMLLREAWSEPEALLLKSLAMLQWAGEVSSLHPTPEALQCALKPTLDEIEVQQTLHTLRRRAAIVYRSFNRTYRVWQGSDVDVEERLRDARQQVGQQISLASVLNRLVPPPPAVARRHSYQTGTLRAFEVRYVDDIVLTQPDLPSLLMPSEPFYAGVVCVCLPRHRSQTGEFEHWAQSPSVVQQAQCIIGVPQQGVRLQELLVELVCLDWVQSHTPALRDDPVARRELRERTALVTQAIREQVQQALRSCRWFYRGEDWTQRAQPSLSSLLSEVCDRLFTHTPILRNELINRWTLSSAAAAGRRNLIQAMLEHPFEERLGIAGYPPERSMYESVLRDTGIHVPGALGWRFEPPPANHQSRLQPLWERLYCRIFTEPPERINVAELLQELVQPPYGITPGVFPVILCAFLQVYADETTLYREGTFLPEPGIADWEVLLRRPELFEVAGCRTGGAKARMLQLIAQCWDVPPKTVPVVRELVRRLRQLPEHAKRTKRISPAAIALRQAILQAHSPERLLYYDVPNALGVPVEQVERFYTALDEALRELWDVTPRIIAWARDELLRACGLPEGADGWRQFRQQATALRGKVLNPQLTPLLLRASYTSAGENVQDEAALESVLALVGGRPPRAWTDVEVERFPEAARVYGEAFQQALLLASQEVDLTPQEEELRDALLQRLRRVLSENLSPRVKLSALIHLIKEEAEG